MLGSLEISSHYTHGMVVIGKNLGTILETRLPEHKTYFLYGSASATTDDLTPSAGKRIRLYGFFGGLQADAAFNPTVPGTITFGTGGLSDRTKVLGAHGDLPGSQAFSFTRGPMNRLGAVDEKIRFTMPTYAAGTAGATITLMYNEE